VGRFLRQALRHLSSEAPYRLPVNADVSVHRFEAISESIPLACQDWANTKAAYRFFANEPVIEAEVLAGHFRATRERTTTVAGTLLVLHDTTEFSYPRENIGLLHRSRNPGRSPHSLCGISMHSSLVVTPAGCRWVWRR